MNPLRIFGWEPSASEALAGLVIAVLVCLGLGYLLGYLSDRRGDRR